MLSRAPVSQLLPRKILRAGSWISARTLTNNIKYRDATHATTNVPEEVQRFIDDKARYLLPVYARPPVVLDHGKGMEVFDTQGRKYLDFSGGIAVNALGHSDSRLAEIMLEQATTLLHASNIYHNRWAGVLAEQLATLTTLHGGLGHAPNSSESPSIKAFFSNSGTEANEGALKIARRVGKDRWSVIHNGRTWDYENDPDCPKVGIVCFENAFHGRSMGALSVTPNAKYQRPFGPLIPGVRVGHLNKEESIELIDKDTCAVIVEPIQGEGGIDSAREGWLRALRKRCDETGAVLIFDEIQCGLFRTGTMWAHSELPVDCHPDIVTMAKPLANGYPIGAVLMRDEIAESMGTGSHGTTFGGSPMACRLGSHVLGRISEAEFVGSLRKAGDHLGTRLARLSEMFPNLVSEIRGRGLIRGIAFKKEPSTYPGELVTMARERGVLLLTAGRDAVRLVPSLIVGREEVDVAVDVVESCLGLLSGK